MYSRTFYHSGRPGVESIHVPVSYLDGPQAETRRLRTHERQEGTIQGRMRSARLEEDTSGMLDSDPKGAWGYPVKNVIRRALRAQSLLLERSL